MKIDKVSLQIEKDYNNQIKCVKQDSKFSSVYSIKTNSCSHQLKYLHVINGLPPDLAHNVFEEIAVDVLSDCIGFFCKNNTFLLEFSNNQFNCLTLQNLIGETNHRH